MQSLTSIFGNSKVNGRLEVTNVVMGMELSTTTANSESTYVFASSTLNCNFYYGKYIVKVSYTGSTTNTYIIEVSGSRTYAPILTVTSSINSIYSLPSFFVAAPNALTNNTLLGFNSNTTAKTIVVTQIESNYFNLEDSIYQITLDSDHTVLTIDSNATGVRTSTTSNILVSSAHYLEDAPNVSLTGDVSAAAVSFNGHDALVLTTVIGNSKVTNAMLVNKTIKLGSTTVELGNASQNAIEGLTSVTATDFYGKTNGIKSLITKTGTSGNGLFLQNDTSNTNQVRHSLSSVSYDIDYVNNDVTTPTINWKLTNLGGSSTMSLTKNNTTNKLTLVVDNITATITGDISGNSESTTKWRTARAFHIEDSAATPHTGYSVNVNGTSAITLKLPNTIKATIEGNVTGDLTGTARDALKITTPVNLSITDGTNTGTSTSFDGSGNAVLNLPGTIIASLTGTARDAQKLTTAVTFKTANYDGSEATTGASFDGTAGATLRLPANLKGTLTGNASTANHLTTIPGSSPAILLQIKDNQGNVSTSYIDPGEPYHTLYMNSTGTGFVWAAEGSHVPGSANWRSIYYYPTNLGAAAKTEYKTGAIETGSLNLRPGHGMAINLGSESQASDKSLVFVADLQISDKYRTIIFTPPTLSEPA